MIIIIIIIIQIIIIIIIISIIIISIIITCDGGSEENPDDDEYPSVGAKAVLAVCFDPSRTEQIEDCDYGQNFGRINNKGLGYDNDGESVCQCDSLYFCINQV